MWNTALQVRPRYSPLWREVDTLLGQLASTQTPSHPLRLLDDGDAYRLVAELPGVSQDDVAIEATERSVTVRARRELPVPEGARLVAAERRAIGFRRSLSLRDAIVVDDVTATLQHGMLTVLLPKRAELAPRKITVQGGK